MAGFNVFPAALTKGTPCPSANILALLPIIISIGVAGIKLAEIFEINDVFKVEEIINVLIN